MGGALASAAAVRPPSANNGHASHAHNHHNHHHATDSAGHAHAAPAAAKKPGPSDTNRSTSSQQTSRDDDGSYKILVQIGEARALVAPAAAVEGAHRPWTCSVLLGYGYAAHRTAKVKASISRSGEVLAPAWNEVFPIALRPSAGSALVGHVRLSEEGSGEWPLVVGRFVIEQDELLEAARTSQPRWVRMHSPGVRGHTGEVSVALHFEHAADRGAPPRSHTVPLAAHAAGHAAGHAAVHANGHAEAHADASGQWEEGGGEEEEADGGSGARSPREERLQPPPTVVGRQQPAAGAGGRAARPASGGGLQPPASLRGLGLAVPVSVEVVPVREGPGNLDLSNGLGADSFEPPTVPPSRAETPPPRPRLPLRPSELSPSLDPRPSAPSPGPFVEPPTVPPTPPLRPSTPEPEPEPWEGRRAPPTGASGGSVATPARVLFPPDAAPDTARSAASTALTARAAGAVAASLRGPGEREPLVLALKPQGALEAPGLVRVRRSRLAAAVERAKERHARQAAADGAPVARRIVLLLPSSVIVEEDTAAGPLEPLTIAYT